MGKQQYKSDIVLGERYRDTQTGLEGIATAIYFYQYGCERVSIETLNESDKTISGTAFDAPRLQHVESGKVATVKRTGGPGDGREARPTVTR